MSRRCPASAAADLQFGASLSKAASKPGIQSEVHPVETLSTALGHALRSPGAKFFLIAALILMLAIPLLLVWVLIEERSQHASGVASQIAQEWGEQQTIIGPFLVVPYTVSRTITQGEKQIEEIQERRAVFLPSATAIDGKAMPKVLSRSIYNVTVYSSALSFAGRFDAPNMAEVAPDAKTIRWGDALLAVSISDVSGLKSTAALKVNGGADVVFNPSLGLPGYGAQGIHARLGGSPAVEGQSIKAFDFTFALNLDGSSSMFFAPIARDTVVSLQSPWPHPSFTGNFLPTDRAVSDQGFTSRWQIPHLARSVPHAWTIAAGGNEYGEGPTQRLAPFSFGVNYYIPVDFYDLASRAAKYAMMFLATAFMAVFLMEMGSARPVHAVQYLFVGLTMVFFYVLLLSLAEHIGFEAAYVAAAGATSGMLALYIAKAQASPLKGLIMLGVLLALYALLYLILRLEDYALLAGAIGGFLALTVVMFATLRVDWSGRKAMAT
jgi:inner membrane protein